MPIPLIPIAAALAKGGTLVAHSSGGLIVTTAASGYLAGTFLSTTAVTAIVTGASVAAGALAACGVWATGAASAIWGSAGWFGTTIGASGVKGMLMSLGLISSTPIWIPVTFAVLALIAISISTIGIYRLYHLKKRLSLCEEGTELIFTDSEAKIVERLIKLFTKRPQSFTPEIRSIAGNTHRIEGV
jgi:hypothetical protein